MLKCVERPETAVKSKARIWKWPITKVFVPKPCDCDALIESAEWRGMARFAVQAEVAFPQKSGRHDTVVFHRACHWVPNADFPNAFYDLTRCLELTSTRVKQPPMAMFAWSTWNRMSQDSLSYTDEEAPWTGNGLYLFGGERWQRSKPLQHHDIGFFGLIRKSSIFFALISLQTSTTVAAGKDGLHGSISETTGF